MKKKRILFSAYAYYPEFGGLEQQMHLLSQEFIMRGHSVTILTEKHSPVSPTTEIIDGVIVIRLPFTKKRTVLDYIILVLSLSHFIIKTRNEYDRAYLRAALTLYPLVFGFWKKAGLISYPTAVTADTGGEDDEIISLKKWKFYKILLPFFKAHDKFNSICTANYRHYKELAFTSHKLTKISNGVDTSLYVNAMYPQKVKHFIFIGRFIKEKGIYELLKAMSIVVKGYPKTKLFLAGDGPELSKMKRHISRLGLNKTVILCGKVSGKEKEQFFSKGECLVLPSYSEGLPLVVLEAAVRKKVLLTTDVSDLKDMFGEQLILTEKKDSNDLALKMIKVLQVNFKNKLKYDSVVQSVDIKKVAKQYLAILD